jgi:cytoskeleton protein RodZ
MATVADQLRRAREEQNLNVYQVAEITKIKTDHIRALEAGEWGSFSAPVYIRGFVRTYAKTLKLDVAKVTADLESELSQNEKFSEPPPLSQKRSGMDFLMLQLSKLNRRAVAVIGGGLVAVIAVVVGIRACNNRPKADPLENLGPGLYHSKPGESGDKLPLPNTPPPPPKKT